MNKFLIGGALAVALTSTTLSASPMHKPGETAGIGATGGEQIWLAQGNGKGNGNGPKKILKKGKADKAKGPKAKPEQAKGPKAKDKDKPGDVEQASNGKGKGNKARKVYSADERDDVVARIVSTPAPAGRDMLGVLGATGLVLVGRDVVITDVTDDELLTYRNCPPGLAKKDPPCVPPGLAKKGVTYEEWASYDGDRYDEIWRERRDEWLDSEFDFDPDPELLLLRSDQVATLFGLDAAPEGQRYALIDGLPVLLDDEDYNALLLVNEIAQVADLTDGLQIAPTAALTQDELISLYRLPALGADENYAVLNGQLLRLNDSEYEMLQMIRIARAVL